MQATIYISLSIIFIVHTSDAFRFVDHDCLPTIKSDGISFVNHGINLLNSSIKISGRFFEALQDLYNTDKNTFLPIISSGPKIVGKYFEVNFEFFKDFNLDEVVIYTYTDFFEVFVDRILDDHKCGKMNLTETQKTLGPFTAYLMAVILYSPNLPKETNLTSLNIDWRDIDLYKVGTTFMWSSFASSNEGDKKSKHTMVINNSQESMWSPRRIEQYSPYPEDKEPLYPPGAMFRVTEKRRRGQEVYLYADLISED